MAPVTHYDLELHQIDFKTTFLNEELEENVFVAQRKGFVVRGKKKYEMPLKEVHLWTETSFQTVVSEPLFSMATAATFHRATIILLQHREKVNLHIYKAQDLTLPLIKGKTVWTNPLSSLSLSSALGLTKCCTQYFVIIKSSRINSTYWYVFYFSYLVI